MIPRSVVLGALLFAPSFAGAQASQMPESAANLIVRVSTFAPDGEQIGIGAGIIIMASNRLVMVTAAHVINPVRDSGTAKVVFHFARQDTFAVNIDQVDIERDIALLSLDAKGLKLPDLSFDRQGDPWGLDAGDPVIPVGCPDGRCWQPPVSPNRVISGQQSIIRFESYFISTGSSGGALFNRHWEIVGMVIEQSQLDGRAVSIRQVLERSRSWGYPAQLRRKRVPRAGYGSGLSLQLLGSTEGGIREPGRLPGGRVAMGFRGQRRIGWHVAAFRLAPENLAVTGGALGLDLRLNAGRLSLTPFGEVGVARVEGRFDTGGFISTGAGGEVYNPIWSKAEDDVLGVGAGASLALLVAPHISIEGLIAHWEFKSPDRVTNNLPSLMAGAGLKFSF